MNKFTPPPGTKMPEPYIEFDASISQPDVDVEDGGKAMIVEPMADGAGVAQRDELFVRLHSWSEKGDHHQLARLIGERVRITITILPKKSGA